MVEIFTVAYQLWTNRSFSAVGPRVLNACHAVISAAGHDVIAGMKGATSQSLGSRLLDQVSEERC